MGLWSGGSGGRTKSLTRHQGVRCRQPCISHCEPGFQAEVSLLEMLLTWPLPPASTSPPSIVPTSFHRPPQSPLFPLLEQASPFLPQDLCTGSSHCRECSSLRSARDGPILSSDHTSPHPWGPRLTIQLKGDPWHSSTSPCSIVSRWFSPI